MSASDDFEAGLLDLVFLNQNLANIGDATGLRGSTTAGSLYLSLHTADPGETGDQTTNETAYGGYARVAVPRSGAGFSRAGNVITLVANADFAACTSGSATITHFAIGTAASGAGKRLVSGPVTPNIPVSTPVAPRLETGTSCTVD